MNTPVTAPPSAAYDGPSPALEVSIDIVKRGVVVAPVLVLIGALIWGNDGAASVLLGLGIVLVNFWLSAFSIAWGAKISIAALGAAAMFGFLIRLSIITVVVLTMRNLSWVDLVALGITIVVTHLGLLLWELRYISSSLAFPGLKPDATSVLGKNTDRDKESIAS